MAKFRFSQFNLNVGEISDLAKFRADNDVYKASVDLLENAVPLSQGGIVRRSGSYAWADYGSEIPKIGVFDFNNEQQYIVAFYTDSIDVITNWDTLTKETFSGFGWTASDVKFVRYVQSNDVMIITHFNYGSWKLFRTDAGTFEIETLFETVSPDQRVYFNFPEFQNAELYVSANTARYRTKVSALASATATPYFIDDHVGVGLKLIKGTTFHYGTITSLIGTAPTTEVNVTWYTAASAYSAPISTSSYPVFAEEAFSDVRGYPRTLVFHQQRLYLGGGRTTPNVLYASQTGDFFNFKNENTTLDSSSFSFTLSTDNVHTIRDMHSDDNLIIHTSRGEFIGFGGNNNPITPSNVQITQKTNNGISSVKSYVVDNESLYITENDEEIRAFAYDIEQDDYISKNYSLLHTGKLLSPVDMAILQNYKNSQTTLAFIVNSNGELACMVTDRSRRILGWSRWITNGSFKYVTVAKTKYNPDSSDTAYVLYATVQRGNKYYIEVFGQDDIYLDFWRKETSSTANTATFSHGDDIITNYPNGAQLITLDSTQNNVTKEVIIDEEISGSDGVFTTEDNFINSAYVGLPYITTVRTLPLTGLVNELTMRKGQPMKILRVWAQVFNTSQFAVEGNELITLKYDFDNFDGFYPIESGLYWSRVLKKGRDPQLTFMTSDPVRMTFLGYTMEVHY